MQNIGWTHWQGCLGIILVVLLLSSSVVMANQGYNLSWWTVDGGGGVSNGGRFAVSGTIGQPDAGMSLSGDSYSLQGGFWIDGMPLPDADIETTIFLPLIIKKN